MTQEIEAKHSPLSAFIAYMAIAFSLAAMVLRPLVPAASDRMGLGGDLVLHLLVVTAFVTWILLFLLDQHLIFVRARIEAPALALAGLLVASPFVAASPLDAVHRVASWGTDLLLFYLLFNAALQPRLRGYLFRIAAGVAIAVALYAAYQAHEGLDETRRHLAEHPEDMPDLDPEGRRAFLERLGSQRPFGTMILATLLAGYLILFLPPLVGQIVDRVGAKRRAPAAFVADLAALGAIGYGLFLTRTRGAFLALAAGLAVMLALSARDVLSRKKALVPILLLLAAVAAGLGTAWEKGWFGADPLAEAKKSLEYRTGYWSGAWRVAQAHPWTGVGADNLRYHYYRHKPAWAPESAYAHNNWLQVAAEFGFPGLLVLAAVWAGLFRAMARPAKDDPERARPPAANHFVPLEFGSTAAWTTTIVVLVFTFLLYSLLERIFDVLPPGGLLFGLLAAGLAYVLVEPVRPVEGAEGLPERFRRRGLVAALVAGLVHWLVDFDLYSQQTSQAIWVVAALALASYRRPDATGDVVFRAIPFLASPPPASAPAKGKKGEEPADPFLVKLFVVLALILVPWGLFVFKVVVPQFRASAWFAWGLEGFDEASDLRAEARGIETKDPKGAADKKADARMAEDQAIDHFEQVLETNPGHVPSRMRIGAYQAEAWRGRAKHFRDLDRHRHPFEEAEEHLGWVAQNVPGYTDASFQLHRLYRDRGALRMGAMERAPGELRAGRDQATVEAVREGWLDLRRADEALERAIEWYPTQPRYLLESARWATALAGYREKALAAVPDLEAMPFDAAERSRERYRRALEVSESLIEANDRLSDEEVAEARKALD